MKFVFTHKHFIRLNRTDAIVVDLHFSHRLTQYPERAPKAGKNICLGYCYYMLRLFIIQSWSNKTI